jgi:RES domain-containing protein
LEILAGRAGELPDDYVAFSIAIPDSLLVTELFEPNLPRNWWVNPQPVETRDLGTQWVRDGQTAVLSVPSAVIRSERNYILNTAHPDFDLISFGESEEFLWDSRLRMLRQ